jgi:hypothetical protein
MTREGAAGPERARTGSGTGPLPPSEPSPVPAGLPGRIALDPDRAGQDLGRLVLTLLEFLRQALEHQAIRRLEAGSLSEEEEERLGLGLLRLHEKMAELKDVFDLTDEDLNIDLGPLGRLL